MPAINPATVLLGLYALKRASTAVPAAIAMGKRARKSYRSELKRSKKKGRKKSKSIKRAIGQAAKGALKSYYGVPKKTKKGISAKKLLKPAPKVLATEALNTGTDILTLKRF